MERGHEGLRPEITRSEWALSITCIVLTVFTLATFLIAGSGGKGKQTSNATGSSEVAARSTAKNALSAKKAVSSKAASKKALASKKAASSKKAVPLEPAAGSRSPVATITPTPVVPSEPVRAALPRLLVDAAPQGYVKLSSGSGPSGAFDLASFTRLVAPGRGPGGALAERLPAGVRP